MAVHVGLPPPLASALSLIATQSLNSFFDPGLTLKAGLLQIAPDVATQLTLGGLELLGRSIGLDPRITALMGLPVAASIGGTVKGAINGSGSIINSVKDALFSRETLAGMLSIGAEFALDQVGATDSAWGSLLSRLSVGLVKDFIQTGGKVNVFDSLVNSSQKTISHLLDPALLPRLFVAVAEHGLAGGFEQYAISVLRRDTIEDFVRGGVSFADQLALALQAPVDADCGGQACKAVHLAKNDKMITFKYFFNEGEFEIYGIQEVTADADRRFMFQTDADGNITGVRVQVLDENGQVITERDLTGDIRDTVQFTDFDGNIFAEISISEDGKFEFVNYNLGVSGNISQYGEVEFSYRIPELEDDLGSLIGQFNAANLTAEQKSEIVFFSVGNGFWNQHATKNEIAQLSRGFIQDLSGDLGTLGIPPAILYENGHIAVDSGGNILTTASLPITLYEETGLIGNGLKWACETWFGCNDMKEEIISEVTHYMNVLTANGFDPTQMNMVHFSHSGNFQPMIKALEDPRLADLNLKTLVVFEGPYVGDGVINNTNLDTIIRIVGTSTVLDGDAPVPFLNHRQFSAVDGDGNSRPITNYNIEILGAKHSDFDASSNHQVNLFMRDLSLMANDPQRLEKFLKLGTTQGVKYDPSTGKITVNPDEYESPFGDRL